MPNATRNDIGRPALLSTAVLAGLLFVLVSGCGDGTDPVTATGTVTITCSPDELTIPWTLRYRGELLATGEKRRDARGHGQWRVYGDLVGDRRLEPTEPQSGNTVAH